MSQQRMSGGLLARLTAPQPPPPWSLGEAAALPVALLLATLLMGTTIVSILVGGSISPFSLLLGWTLGLVIVTGYVLATRRQQGHLPALGLQAESALPLPFVLLTGVAAAMTIDVIVAAGGGFQVAAMLTGIGVTDDWLEWLLAAIFVIFLQPLAENLVFQAVLLPRLRASFGGGTGILLTAAVYTVYYLLVYGAVLSGGAVLWYGVLMPLLTGLFLAGVRVYTGSTRAAILAQVGMGITMLLAALVLTG
jgi:membrane protease YdiL (CAAX protease family)